MRAKPLQGLGFFFRQNPHGLVVVLWLFFQTLWYLRFGFVFTLEAPKYIEEAQYVLQHHHLSQFRYLFYFTTVAVIALSAVLKTGLVGALLFIMAVNLAAYLYFFSALQRFFGRTAPALAVVVLLLSFWPYQSWSMFLFTECMFYSLVLMLFGHLLRFRQLTLRFLSGCCAVLFLLIISRPLGILFVPPVLLFIFVHLRKRQRLLFALAGIGFLVLLNFIVQVVFTTTPDWNMTRALTEDSIICDVPRGDATTQLELTHHPNQFYQLFYYVMHNFGHFAGLALLRLRYFFGMVRDYYSAGHNAYLIAYLVVFYGSIFSGLKQIIRSLPPALSLFILSSVLLFAAAIALQCDDYHNRFFLTLTPFFVLLTVVAWRPFMRWVFSFATRRKG